MLKRLALVLVVLTLGAAGEAVAQGADWRSVDRTETKVRLDLPETEGKGVFLKSQSED
jgi:hypothetical protein